MEEAAAKAPDGIVLPPKEIRAIVEKTAGYVARNGPVFEDRIREKEIRNPKFSFLSQGDAYNPYYAWRLNEVREGRGSDVSAGRVGEAQAADKKPKGPDEPPAFEFSTRMPTINAKDLDILRLTAQFAAKNGRNFIAMLTQKYAGNFQFDFLRPTHSLFPYFSRMIDQYTDLLTAGDVDEGKAQKRRIESLRHMTKDRTHILERAKIRAEWQRHQLQQRQKKEEQDEKDKLEYAQIDWHDFVVAETIEFTDADDSQDLVPPTSLGELQSASLEQKAMRSLAPGHMRIEEAMPTDDSSSYYDTAPQVQYPGAPVMPPPPSYTPHPLPQAVFGAIPPPPVSYPPAPQQLSEEDEAIRARTEARERAQAIQAAARGGGPMRIRNDYVPRAQTKRPSVDTAICPNCKQAIPTAELDAHMRIELLDPEWKKQRAKAEARFSTTNLAPADVANNLKRLASQRSDVFDPVTGQQVPTPEEEARMKQQRMSAIQYDGQPESRAQLSGLNIDEQIRLIHQKAKQ